MFARLLGNPSQESKDVSSLLHRALPPRRPGRAQMPPLPASLTEAELDHLLDYWARARPRPLTATVRLRLFTHHLAVTLETHPLYERMVHDARRGPAEPLIPTLVHLARDALLAARAPHVTLDHPDRLAIGIPAFAQELDDRLAGLQDPAFSGGLDTQNRKALGAIILETLAQISHEHTLAKQISETAILIRGMEEQLARQKLPDEDLYELKMRRDLFLTDLRLYNRLIRRAMGIEKRASKTQKNLHKSPLPRRSPPAPPSGFFERVLGPSFVARRAAEDEDR